MDMCPTMSTTQHDTMFMNGFPCKSPQNITSSDFKTSDLTTPGPIDDFTGSSLKLMTAVEFPGLNTLGLSVARTDLKIDGIVMPHSHPRASEMMFVAEGVVRAGFVDTRNKMFLKVLREGDVFVFPRGLLHFTMNAGYRAATVFSVLNSQNPGVVSVVDAVFGDGSVSDMIGKKLRSLGLITT